MLQNKLAKYDNNIKMIVHQNKIKKASTNISKMANKLKSRGKRREKTGM